MPGRGDPRLGQPVHAIQISQVGGVADIIFDPPVGQAFDAQRMREVDTGVHGLQTIDGPIQP
jgi:hypothetical protein